MTVENVYRIDLISVKKRLYWEISQLKIQQVRIDEHSGYQRGTSRCPGTKRTWSSTSVSRDGQRRNSLSIPLLFSVFNSSLATRRRKIPFEVLLPISSRYIPRKDEFFLLRRYSQDSSCSEIDVRAIAYMTIDINRRLLTRHDYINVLNTLTQLHEELPVHLINEVTEGLHRTLRRTFRYSCSVY